MSLAVNKFKICIIGCGAIANSMHGPALLKYQSENPDIILCGCCDIDAARAEMFKEKFKFQISYTCFETMLAEMSLDAVCLISPVELTASLAEKILRKGIPLLLEKPPGRTKEETLCLIKAAEEKNVPHMVAFNRRYASLIRKLKEIIKADFSPNAVQSIQYDMFRVNRLDEDFSTTAIHAIDTAKFIAGSDYKTIHFTYRDYPEIGKNVSDVHMECTMESGTIVKINICPVTGINMERAVVNFHDHTIFLDYLGTELIPAGRLLMLQKNKIVLDISGNETKDGKEQFEREGFYYVNKHFFDSVRNGVNPSGDLKSTLQSVEIADYIRKRITEFTC